MATLTAEMVGATLLVTLAGDLVADPLTEDRAALAVLLAELDELGGIVVDLRGVTSLGRAGASVVLCCYQQAPRFCPVTVRAGGWARSVALVTRAGAGLYQYGWAAIPCV